MKTKILIKIKREGIKWVGLAYATEGAFRRVEDTSKSKTTACLEKSISNFLNSYGKHWIGSMKHGGNPSMPNCPEGAVDLPADNWICKLTKQDCPIQAMVFIHDRDHFLKTCLAPPARKKQIYKTVTSGKYDGFHHLPGRYLCVDCDAEKKTTAFKYHYPWEMTHIENCIPFPKTLSRSQLRTILRHRNLNPLAANNALCAHHSKRLADAINLEESSNISVIEMDIYPRNNGSSTHKANFIKIAP